MTTAVSKLSTIVVGRAFEDRSLSLLQSRLSMTLPESVVREMAVSIFKAGGGFLDRPRNTIQTTKGGE
ncbi:hypothetical protein RHS01_05261 [Rhizoctonia solani]|uniref:Uncharacterized protein n=1 Tax=Rhizoctonia solani TaxID=456999 RepID=A0A8H7IDZ6_9AGAM|nr:hypothetical protein RHS01_05261 [Rhizoctonia solani]